MFLKSVDASDKVKYAHLWKKELRETACDYIARWWYDVDIPFNATRSPYYEPIFDAIYALGKGFKGLLCMS